MKRILGLLALIPATSMAGNKINLPLNNIPGELCYIRIYSAEHLQKNPKQKIKAAAVTITNQAEYGSLGLKTEVVTLDGKSMFNYGALLSTKSAPQVKGALDDDGGTVRLKQSQSDQNKISLTVLTHLALMEDNYTTNENIPEGTPYDVMGISAGSADSVWVLERVRANGSANPSCSEILKNRL